jgi:hypothetical protein
VSLLVLVVEAAWWLLGVCLFAALAAGMRSVCVL